jgi:uncharacterized protein (DUF924 family)
MNSSDDWVEDVLRFWFEELTPQVWFERDDAVDAMIRTRFASLHDRLNRETAAAASMTAREALATVIVLDQFSRNLFRESARAFASDVQALSVAQEVVEKGLDRELNAQQRHFLYMPFQHSEDPTVQRRSIELFGQLGGEALDYARRHKAVIDRFGRYPARNQVLGRVSTPEEIEYLKGRPAF